MGGVGSNVAEGGGQEPVGDFVGGYLEKSASDCAQAYITILKEFHSYKQ